MLFIVNNRYNHILKSKRISVGKHMDTQQCYLGHPPDVGLSEQQVAYPKQKRAPCGEKTFSA